MPPDRHLPVFYLEQTESSLKLRLQTHPVAPFGSAADSLLLCAPYLCGRALAAKGETDCVGGTVRLSLQPSITETPPLREE